jgi:hypothetical protein
VRRTRGIASVGLGIAMALALGAPSARAVAPQRGSFVQSGTEEHDEICGFPVVEDYTRWGRSALFLDPTGLPLSVRTNITATATFTNPSSGRSVIDTDHYVLVLDLVHSTISSFGLVFHVTTGHGRPLLMDVGRVVLGFDHSVIVEDGPHQFLDGDVEAFCAALA